MISENGGGSLFRAFAADGAVRIVALDATAAADETRHRHSLGPDAARVAADAIVAGSTSQPDAAFDIARQVALTVRSAP